MKMTMLQRAALFARTAASPYRRRNLTLLRGLATVGDQLPSVELHTGWPPQKHNLAEFAADKSLIVLGLPGAFTPT